MLELQGSYPQALDTYLMAQGLLESADSAKCYWL